MSQDLSVNGPFSPVSLKKFFDTVAVEKNGNELMVLVDNIGQGIVMDDPETLVMNSEDRLEQARFYREKLFDGKKVPAYLFRYLRYMFINTDDKYPTNESVLQAHRSGELTLASEEYQRVVNLIRYSDANLEAAQIIGFIQLFSGTIKEAKMKSKRVRLLIQHPETDLHPKRAARWMSLFYKLQAEYGVRS